MSKLTTEQITSAVEQALEHRKKRKFVESLDFQVMFRDFDLERDKRFNSATTLNHDVRTIMKICVIGTMNHVQEAKTLGLEGVSTDDLKKFNNEEKLIKKWARRFDCILVSESKNKEVTRMIGRYITRIGKLPIVISEKEKIHEKVNELKKTIRFRVKKVPWLAQSVAVDSLTADEIRSNLTKSVNFLVSLLPKGWQNIKAIHIKTTMGKPVKLY